MRHEEESSGRRIERVESELRRIRRQVDRRKTVTVLKARQIELVDEHGRTRAVLAVEGEEAVVRIVGPGGRTTTKIRVEGTRILAAPPAEGDEAIPAPEPRAETAAPQATAPQATAPQESPQESPQGQAPPPPPQAAPPPPPAPPPPQAAPPPPPAPPLPL